MTQRSIVLVLVIFACCQPASAQSTGPIDDSELYQQLRKFELGSASASVSGLVMQKDRARLTFSSGVFYFAAPVGGVVYGAVFIGKGQLQAEVPDSLFERQHVERMLQSQVVESDFETAVLRFTDDTFEKIRGGSAQAWR
jgi:hypothetical protein